MCGFEFATDKNKGDAFEKLRKTQPSDQTALRDAVFAGITRILKLKGVKLSSFSLSLAHSLKLTLLQVLEGIGSLENVTVSFFPCSPLLFLTAFYRERSFTSS